MALRASSSTTPDCWSCPELEDLLHALADGSLKHADVFEQHGHGALIYDPEPFRWRMAC